MAIVETYATAGLGIQKINLNWEGSVSSWKWMNLTFQLNQNSTAEGDLAHPGLMMKSGFLVSHQEIPSTVFSNKYQVTDRESLCYP